MFASLPMYDFPEHREHTDRLWSLVADALRAEGIAAPDHLARPSELPADWLRPDLLLSQTCGLPFVRRLRGRVELVGAADHGLPDCAPGNYRSRIVVRGGMSVGSLADLRGRVAAVNSDESQSGAGALRTAVQPFSNGRPFFAHVIRTGSHLGSIMAVAEGRAEVAAIDAVTYAMALRHRAEARFLRVLSSTPETPGLPFITRPGAPARALFTALADAVDAVGHEARDALMLQGIVPRTEAGFDGIADADRTAVPLAADRA
jgi:ABC-type phosphate/phosphonate transport system substrate-binding protein